MKTFVDHDACTTSIGKGVGEQDRGSHDVLGLVQGFGPSIRVEHDALWRLGIVSCRVHDGGGLDLEGRGSGSTELREICLNEVNWGPGKLEMRVRAVVANRTMHEP